MGKIVTGHIVEKRYSPAKPDGEHAQLGRAEDEYHAANVGDTFHGGHHRNLSGLRAARKNADLGDPNIGAARAANQALVRDLSGW